MGQAKKLKLVDECHWKDEKKEYVLIMIVLDAKMIWAKIVPIPLSTAASPRLQRDAQHAPSSLENASIAVKMPISLVTAKIPFVSVSAQSNLDVGSEHATKIRKNRRKGKQG